MGAYATSSQSAESSLDIPRFLEDSKDSKFQKCDRCEEVNSPGLWGIRGRCRAKGPNTDNENPGPMPLPGTIKSMQGYLKIKVLPF